MKGVTVTDKDIREAIEKLEEELRKGEKYFTVGSRKLDNVSFKRVRQGISYTRLIIRSKKPAERPGTRDF